MTKKEIKEAISRLDDDSLAALRAELGITKKPDSDVLDAILDLSTRVSALEKKEDAPVVEAPAVEAPKKSGLDKFFELIRG